MKLLVVGINFTPEIISTAVYTAGLVAGMVDEGETVEVVTAQPYFPAWKVFPGHPAFWWSRRRYHGGRVRVVHCPHYVPSRPTGVRRLFHHASFCISAMPVLIWKMIRFRPDLVLVVAPSLMIAPLAWLAARAGRAKTWLHIQDFEVEAAIATGLLRADTTVGRMAKRFDHWVHHRFDRVSTISDPMMGKLRARGIPEHRLFELRNWADLSLVKPMPEGSSPYRDIFDISTAHVVLYSGNIANKQGLEILPVVAALLADRHDLTFVVCGEGPFLAELRRLADGLGNVRFFPLQPREKLGDLMALASVHLLPQIAGVADAVLPSKLTNMMASGRPVIATAEPGTSLALAIKNCGTISPPGDAKALAAAIRCLLDDPDLRAAQGMSARNVALTKLDSRPILRAFHQEAVRLIALDDRRAGSTADID